MDKKAVLKVLPVPLRRMADLPWLPWPWILHRHRDLPSGPLAALFEAYAFTSGVLDIPRIIFALTPVTEEDACRRCGSCCAELIPDPVTRDQIRRWAEAGSPLAEMYRKGRHPKDLFTGWSFAGEDLRLCPFLLRDPEQGCSPCTLHSLERPPACAVFEPSYPHCAVCYRPDVL